MREITIDFENCSYSQFAGYLGEHNATKIKVKKPSDLSGSTFLLAFMINGEIVHSSSFTSDEEIEVDLWSQLTQDKTLYIQLKSYCENGEYLGKSAVAKLVFGESLAGTDAIADTDNPDLLAEINANTAMRKKFADNADVLVEFSVSDSGELLFDGKQIGKGDPYTLTEEDTNKIVDAVLDALPEWQGGSY